MYYYPFRPILIPPDKGYILSLEQSGLWIAEQKWNGDNTTIYTGTIPEFWNRKKERLRYTPIPEVITELSKFPDMTTLNAETVHYHTKTIKNLIIVHCTYVWKGQPLFGKTWQYSRDLLETQTYETHVVLSKIHTRNFWDLYQDADGSIIEGIVLKRKNGIFNLSTRPISDIPWMLKVRKPSAKYLF